MTGYRHRQPTYIKMSGAVLKHMQPGSDVLMLQGVCQMLLGEVQAALRLIKQAANAGGRGEDSDQWGSAAFSYVTHTSPAGDDGLLPGLCLFTETWLKQVNV